MRAAIFIDGAYLIKQLHEARIVADYSRVAEYLLAPLRQRVPLDLMRCFFYDCPPWMSDRPTEDERRRMAIHERFVGVLEDIDRWQVRLGKLERRRERDNVVFSQKRVDVQLSVDLVRHAAAGHIQHAVLVAGDSDFIPAVAAAKESGVTLTLWCGRDKSPHKDLMVAADEVQLLDWSQFPRKAMRPTSQTTASGARGSVTGSAVAKEDVAAGEGGDGTQVAANGEAPKRKKSRRGGRGRRRGRGGGQGAPGQDGAQPAAQGAEVVDISTVRGVAWREATDEELRLAAESRADIEPRARRGDEGESREAWRNAEAAYVGGEDEAGEERGAQENQRSADERGADEERGAGVRGQRGEGERGQRAERERGPRVPDARPGVKAADLDESTEPAADGGPDAPQKRSRRGGRGRGRGAKGEGTAAAAPAPVEATPKAEDEPSPPRGRGGRATKAKPVKAATQPKVAATPVKAAPKTPAAAVKDDEPGDDVGNRAEPGEAGAKKSRRRGSRGGRGRRRGGNGSAPAT